jgi:hypothetical protein
MVSEHNDTQRLLDALLADFGDLEARVRALEEAAGEAEEAQAPLFLLDLDGVLADFNRDYYAYLTWSYPPPPGAFDRWHWPQKFVSQALIDAKWPALETSEFFWATLQAYPEAQAIVRLTREAAARVGGTVAILTSRPDTHEVRRGTQTWLRETFPNWAPETFFAEDKAAWCGAHPEAVFLLDDKPSHVRAVNARSLRCAAYLWRQPWNEADAAQAEARGVEELRGVLEDVTTLVGVGA